MACCGVPTVVRRNGWSPNPLAGYMIGGRGAFRPAVGTVDTSAGAPACCDACAAAHDDPEPSAAGCASGVCGVKSAGIPMPVGRDGRVLEEADQYAAAWRRAVAARGGRTERRAGTIMAIDAPRFVRSTLNEVRGMSTDDLNQRLYDLSSLDGVLTTEQDAELTNVAAEIDRRAAAGGGSGDGGDAGSDEEPLNLTPEEWAEKREMIGRETAQRLAPGTDAASAARRDAIIRQAVTGTFSAFSQYLDREYDTRLAQIRGTTDVTLQRLRNEDAQARRDYDLLRHPPSSSSSSSGGGAAVAGLGLLGLLWTIVRGG